mgnify:CR=1 FL=1
MRPASMVVTKVLAKDPSQVSLIEHDDVIQTVPTNGTYHAFGEWILPRRAGRCYDLLNTQALDPLGRPLSGWVSGNVEVHDLTTVMA